MRKREKWPWHAHQSSSALIRERHQSQAPAEFNHLGELMLGQSFSSLWLLGLQTVIAICIQSFAPLGPILQGLNLSLIHHLSNFGSH